MLSSPGAEPGPCPPLWQPEALPELPFKKENLPLICEECQADNLLLQGVWDLPQVSSRGHPSLRQLPASDSARVWPFLHNTGLLYWAVIVLELPPGLAMTA